MGLNWFIPALANSRVGSLTGTTAELGQKVWPFDLKKSTKVVRTLAPLHSTAILTDCRRGAELTQRALLNAPRCVRVSVTRIKKMTSQCFFASAGGLQASASLSC
jgi:hypothetical protein